MRRAHITITTMNKRRPATDVTHVDAGDARVAFDTPPPLAGGGWGEGAIPIGAYGSARPPPPNPLPQGEGEYQTQTQTDNRSIPTPPRTPDSPTVATHMTPANSNTTMPNLCSVSLPGSHRRFQPAHTPTRTGWNGRSKPATSRDGDTLHAWIQTSCRMVPPATTRSCSATPTAHPGPETLNELATANASSRERRMETLRSGHGVRGRGRGMATARLPSPVAYPIAVGAMAGHMASMKTRPPPLTCKHSRPT